MYFKKLIPAMVVIATSLLAGNACAFNMPSEFSSLEKYHPSMNTLPSPKGNIKSKILSQYAKWKGTQYRWGGQSRSGIDCSALMQKIFRGSLQMELPRTTGEQIKGGYRITQRDLQPGDLVFFKTSPDDRHVGVYIGQDKFIHASKSQGVTVSELSDSYWQAHYETARRITENV
ncbi:NlpC/P60 family protein [Trabulsiella odontotermitis]|uniref:Glycoside hydrolase n=1 Tax=Trabulsiella odontotermitis TaxID=379893 RepID=A0A0L0H0X4_9ENTR|nr:NlpC/P60 family protein [Trabulsiella odontotermitis]KNC94393.1 glycoside hydrolase [Trabulsiella odontotermitis]